MYFSRTTKKNWYQIDLVVNNKWWLLGWRTMLLPNGVHRVIIKVLFLHVDYTRTEL